MTPSIRMPIYHELLWPTLVAIRELGGSATIPEINERVIANEGFTEGQQAVAHGNGRSSEIEYRLAWARSNLKGIGATENSRRGVWSVTEYGRSLTPTRSARQTATGASNSRPVAALPIAPTRPKPSARHPTTLRTLRPGGRINSSAACSPCLPTRSSGSHSDCCGRLDSPT